MMLTNADHVRSLFTPSQVQAHYWIAAAPNYAQATALLLVSGATGALAYLCGWDWREIKRMFRLMLKAVVGLLALGLG